jgi:L-fuconolactonase
MRIIDAHHHLWDPTVIAYRLLDGSGRLAPLVRPVLSREFDAVARANGVTAAVAVEAASAGADPVAETRWLSDETAHSAVTSRIVAYAPVEHPQIDGYLHALAVDKRITGIRRTFESVPDGFILSDAVVAGIRAVGRRGYCFDLVLFSDRLEEAAKLVTLLPDVRFVLDHLGKPPITGAVPAQWADNLAAIARHPNVVAKISGLVTEAADGWSADLVRPYADAAIAAFGWSRLMFGSDWPICDLAGGYAAWLGFARSLPPTTEDAAAFFETTAARTYRF